MGLPLINTRARVVPGAGRASNTEICFVLLMLAIYPGSGFTKEIISHAVSGDLDGLIDVLSSESVGPTAYNLQYSLKEKFVSLNLTVEFYYSSDMSIDSNDNKCVAIPSGAKIICDLRLVDSLISDFNLSRFRPSLSQKSAMNEYRKIILKWIIAHEIGHIASGHDESDFSGPLKGMLIFDEAQQQVELEADEYAVKLIGSLESASIDEYGVILDIVNSLLVRSLCPMTYPESCEQINPGVGLIYNSSADDPIKIKAGGRHPEFIARFVRIIYIAGLETNQNSINYLARQVIDKFLVENENGEWSSIRNAMAVPK